MDCEAMRIINLIAENIKKIKAVDITPESDCVIISGKNGQGKSSVIDAIWLALEYSKARKENPMPVREGQETGTIQLDLGDYIVTRIIRQDGTSSLKIENKDGDKVSSPQALLDNIVGELSFDPLYFARAKYEEKIKILNQLLGIDLHSYDQKYKTLYEERSSLNKQKKALLNIISNIRPPSESDPQELKSNTEILTAIKEAQLQDKRRSRIHEIDANIERLNAEKVSLLQTLNGSSLDIEELTNQLETLDSYNRRVAEVKHYKKVKDELDTIEKDVILKESAMTDLTEKKDMALTGHALPVDGLEITDDCVKFNGYPFNQLSTSLQTKISTAIAMAINPKLRVIRIIDGSLLDTESMGVIKELAEANDFQVWIERVDETGQSGIVIEDGSVKL